MTRRSILIPALAACSAAALAIAATVAPLTAADVVEIRLRGHFFAAPATVNVTVVVEPDAENRVLRIEADGERMFRSSDVTLSGDSEKRIHTVQFKSLPAGEYYLRAEVLSATGVRGSDTQTVMVAGLGTDRPR